MILSSRSNDAAFGSMSINVAMYSREKSGQEEKITTQYQMEIAFIAYCSCTALNEA